MSPTVAVLAFEGMSPFHLSVPCVVFGDAAKSFDIKVCSESKGKIRTMPGFEILIEYDLSALEQADLIVIPSWHNPYREPSPELLQTLRSAHARGAQIVGLCLGAYVLAASGLLDGSTATTHWAFADDFSRRFPAVHLDADVLYVDEGSIMTSAGTAAGIDCCLHIVRQRLGSESANRIARLLVVPPHRLGGQAQFIDIPIPERVGDKRIAELIDWISANLQANHAIDSLAAKVMMSRRTFTRHFQALTGKPVGQWLLDERLRYCQRLLESSNLPIETVAVKSGFNSVVTLRHHFKKMFGVSPGKWRQTFGPGMSSPGREHDGEGPPHVLL